MQLDIFVPMPTAMPVTGDNVLYSTRVFVDHTSGRPAIAGPVKSEERAVNQISGSFKANQDATIKFQFWDIIADDWVTMNNNGNGDPAPAADGPANFTFVVPHGGDWQVVANFGTPPTAWAVPSKLRLSRTN